jgi:hypothetical protein
MNQKSRKITWTPSCPHPLTEDAPFFTGEGHGLRGIDSAPRRPGVAFSPIITQPAFGLDQVSGVGPGGAGAGAFGASPARALGRGGPVSAPQKDHVHILLVK